MWLINPGLAISVPSTVKGVISPWEYTLYYVNGFSSVASKGEMGVGAYLAFKGGATTLTFGVYRGSTYK